MVLRVNVKTTEGAIKNGQPRNTGDIDTRHSVDKQEKTQKTKMMSNTDPTNNSGVNQGAEM